MGRGVKAALVVAAAGSAVYGAWASGLAGAWTGLVTGAVAGRSVFISLDLNDQSSPWGHPLAHRIQPVVAFLPPLLTLAGAFLAGWRWGWAGAIAGYVLGAGIEAAVGAILVSLARPRD